jgi:hypothetical protein
VDDHRIDAHRLEQHDILGKIVCGFGIAHGVAAIFDHESLPA